MTGRVLHDRAVDVLVELERAEVSADAWIAVDPEDVFWARVTDREAHEPVVELCRALLTEADGDTVEAIRLAQERGS